MPWEMTSKERMKAHGTSLPERKCNHCGKKFFPLEKRTTCCSVSCGVRHAAAVKAGLTRGYNWRDEPVGKRCEICGDIFTPKNGTQKYCGDSCYRVAKAEKARERKNAST
jgi:uncharacterized OB-fold protein